MLACGPVGGELGYGERRGAAHARGVTVARPGVEVRERALVAERRETVDGPGRDDLGPRAAIDDVEQRVERRRLARAPEGSRGLGLHEVAVVTQRARLEHVDGRLGLERAERVDDRATHLGVGRRHVLRQSVEALPRADLAERGRGLDARAPELGVIAQTPRQGLDRGRVVGPRERLRCEPTSTGRGSVGELRAQRVAGRPHAHAAHDLHVRVDDDEAGALGAGHRERLRTHGDAEALFARRAVAPLDHERQRHLERRGDVVARALRLTYGAREHALVPREAHVELGVPRAHEQLFEASTQAPPGHLFERAHEISRLDDAARVPLEVQAHAAPEGLGAELDAQRVEHERALLVEVPIEQIERRVVVLADDRPPVPARRLGEVRGEVDAQAVLQLVDAQVGFAPHVLEIRGEALVEPAVGPVSARDVVAEPLMRELVRDEVVGRDVDGRLRVEQHVLVERGRRGVLHAAEDEVAHHDLRVLVPRVRDAEQLAEVLDHLGRALEGALGLVGLALGVEVLERHLALGGQPPRRRLDALERARDDREQVARVRLAHGPLERGDVAALEPLDELAVREHPHAGGDRDPDVGGHLDVRLVVARHEMPRVLFLALGPHLARACGDVLVGLEEVHAASRRGAIVDAHLGARGAGLDGHAQASAVINVIYTFPVDLDAA